MGDKAPTEVPTIVVVSRGAQVIVREVLAGIEEEGVPCSLCDTAAEASVVAVGAVALAYSAAGRSRLEVGVAVGTGGLVCVHHVKRPATDPIVVEEVGEDLPTARRLGHNAARVVVGVALKPDLPAGVVSR
ncbi:glycerol dehydratase reactivase beta/small subunit family protein [Mycobacterium sp. HUMS_1102779]|uniref:glycerol dehydratase reactivase beta/small subunit family protein n=1 Tax=Mycobacterium sp. HUMS_1102779 TaxID=3383487 RepID=UPI00389AA0F8